MIMMYFHGREVHGQGDHVALFQLVILDESRPVSAVNPCFCSPLAHRSTQAELVTKHGVEGIPSITWDNLGTHQKNRVNMKK